MANENNDIETVYLMALSDPEWADIDFILKAMLKHINNQTIQL